MLFAHWCLSVFCSSLKSKELSPVIGHKAIQVAGPTVPPSSSPQSSSQSPHSTEHSPHTLRKGQHLLWVSVDMVFILNRRWWYDCCVDQFQAPRSWPLFLPRSLMASLAGCPTSPQVSRHRSACLPHLLAPPPLMDWPALQGKCPHPPLGRPHWGRPTPFRPRPPWPERSPSLGPPLSPGRDPACPLLSRPQPLRGSLARPWPQFPSPWIRASWMDCLLGRACLQVNISPWQQHPRRRHHRWGCSGPLSDSLWLCPMETVDECRTL